MHKNQKLFRNTILKITKYIKSIPTLFASFYTKTKNRKFTVDQLLTCILKLVKKGYSFRDAPDLLPTKIHYSTIYKFFKKLVQHNVIQNTYNITVKQYLSKSKKKTFLIDTTLIPNKMGIDGIGFNPQLLKHKTSKISFITIDTGIPIDVYVTAGNHYDSKILINQLNQPNCNIKYINTIDNELLGDAGYDSNVIRKKLEEIKFGKLICNRNKRKTKDPIKLQKLVLTADEKIKLKKRHKVENIFSHLKSFKRIGVRYDKKMVNYNNFVFIASLMITTLKTSRNKDY